MSILKTDRLILRQASINDSEFILALLNEPAWHEFIATHSIDTLEKSAEYIEQKLLAMYREHGFGLWLVETIDGLVPVGLCGLLKRESLPHLDLGFALLAQYSGQGFAFEAAMASLAYARNELREQTVLAISKPSNRRSIALLKKLGFGYESEFSHPGSTEVLWLYATALRL